MAHAHAADADGAGDAAESGGAAETGDAAEADCAEEADGAALTHLSGIGKSKAALQTSRSWFSENSSKKSEAR